MSERVDVTLLFNIMGWIGIGLVVGWLTDRLVLQRCTVRDTTDRPFALFVALIGALIGGTVGWSLRTDGNRFAISLAGALLGALVLALVFLVITPV